MLKTPLIGGINQLSLWLPPKNTIYFRCKPSDEHSHRNHPYFPQKSPKKTRRGVKRGGHFEDRRRLLRLRSASSPPEQGATATVRNHGDCEKQWTSKVVS